MFSSLDHCKAFQCKQSIPISGSPHSEIATLSGLLNHTLWYVAYRAIISYLLYPTVTSARSCNNVGHLFWFTILAQHETNDVILYIHSVHKHRGNTFQCQNYKMRLKQRSLNWINSMQVKKILFTNVFFSWSLCLLNMFPWYFSSIFTFSVYWCNRHHRSWPFLECRPSKLYFKILWKYDDWSFRFHHFLENGRFYRENTYKCSPLVTKWQIILHFHCCFNNKYTPYFLG